MKMMYPIILIAFVVFGSRSVFAQTQGNEQQAANIEAFARLYGYVKYFYPGDEAAKINWTDFLWYGIQNVRDAEDNTELLKRLNGLFNPIAPSVQIFKTGTENTFIPVLLIPADVKKFKVIAWQHLGYGDGRNPEYQSRRTNRQFSVPGNKPETTKNGYSKQLFERTPTVGECAEKTLGNGISCKVPVALYGTESGTYPTADKAVLSDFLHKIDGTIKHVLQERKVTTTERLAAVIFTWNVFKHFYPDRANINKVWDEQLVQAIWMVLNTTGQSIPIAGMTEKLSDGHIHISVANNRVYRTLPLKVSLVEGKLIISKADSSLKTKGITQGDILLDINGRWALDVLDTIKKGISGTAQWKTYSALQKLFDGQDNTNIILKIQAGEAIKAIQLTRTAIVETQDFIDKPSVRLGDGIYYVNLSNTPMKQIRKMLPNLVKAKVIVCDLRGYPDDNEDLLRYLLNAADTSRNFYTPQIIYPDFERVTWQREGWLLKPASPHLTAKIVFLTDGRSVSYAESYLGIVKSYKLGTIIGETTAGANGDENSLTVPVTNLFITFTGLVATQPDGSRLQGIGIKPDIIINQTIKAIREGRDLLMEKALDILK